LLNCCHGIGTIRTCRWSLELGIMLYAIRGPRRVLSVERTFAWISRNRRLARDFERYETIVAAFIRLAMIRIMLRRLAANASA
jgi:hypothetical protein